jgi:hypothetical protein
MYVKTTCKKCGTEFHLDLGEMSRELAEKAFRKMDDIPRQCPGNHVELGGFFEMWNLEDALHRAYDLGETEELNIPTDEEHVKALLAEGRDIVDGGSNKVPHLELPSIHSIPGLHHLGFGEFQSATHLYIRRDSPIGTRFYERVKHEEHTTLTGT